MFRIFTLFCNGIPTFLIFKDGQEIARMVGVYPARLQPFIDRAIAT